MRDVVRGTLGSNTDTPQKEDIQRACENEFQRNVCGELAAWCQQDSAYRQRENLSSRFGTVSYIIIYIEANSPFFATCINKL